MDTKDIDEIIGRLYIQTESGYIAYQELESRIDIYDPETGEIVHKEWIH